LGFDIPLIIDQRGDSPTLSGVRYNSPSGSALGDLRVTGRLALIPQKRFRPAVGVLASTWLPTGNDAAYSGAGQTRFGLDLLLGAEAGPIVLRASIGRRHQADDSLLPTGRSGWAFAFGSAYRFGGWQVGPEFYASTATDRQLAAFTSRSTNAEALLGLRFRLSSLVFGAAAGPGLSDAPGTPSYRAMLGLAYAPESTAVPERQSDSVLGSSETAAAAAPKGVPQPVGLSGAATTAIGTVSSKRDGDGDGVGDPLDACPAVYGQANTESSLNGCPADADHDGIADTDDACPKGPGIASNESPRHGCPADRDGDGVVDNADACPDISGEASADPKQNGCKTSITIQGTQLVLVQQIHFKTGSDEILSDSQGLLLQLKQVLAERADIARVAVDGHTDNVGSEPKNLALSRRRALSVVRWLVQNGIDERRLEARGFGPRQPLAPNTTEDGRAKNRRVEFNILRSTELGTRGWKDGPANE
jgi:OmpA-OmpF porin, OOP family